MSSAVSDAVWIDVAMWSGLSGKPQPFTDVECNPPDHVPNDREAWKQWALEHLAVVAEQDAWQPGRYHFTVERRDPAGRPLDNFAQGIWEWRT
ncbi:MAG: hypothetical protein QOD82_7578 [Pseudonocardiales bacterium]|nr:hypothetical protein [Pseudonocardiales bacterium]